MSSRSNNIEIYTKSPLPPPQVSRHLPLLDGKRLREQKHLQQKDFQVFKLEIL